MERTPCWFCTRSTQQACKCGRAYCPEHTFAAHCIICALGFGLFEKEDTPETVSGVLVLSLSAAAGDPYIVTPSHIRERASMPLARVEAMVGTLLQMLMSADFHVTRRAAGVLAAATNSWPTMDPSQLAKTNYSTSLLTTNQVRTRLLSVLKKARSQSAEPIALAILDKLRTADFRELYPGIAGKLQSLACSNMGTRIGETFQALIDFYPSSSYAANERVELMVYEQYVNRQRGAGATMERIWGHRLRYAPDLARMLKKGLWHTNATRFMEWYPGEDEPH